MTDQFFSLKSPRDMLEKAKRERAKFAASPDIDNAFNFSVTARHIIDYVRNEPSIRQVDWENFTQDPDISLLNAVGDRGKHLVLTKVDRPDRPRPKPHAATRVLGGFNSPLNSVALNSTVTKWEIHIDGNVRDMSELANTVLEKWERFLSQHDI